MTVLMALWPGIGRLETHHEPPRRAGLILRSRRHPHVVPWLPYSAAPQGGHDAEPETLEGLIAFDTAGNLKRIQGGHFFPLQRPKMTNRLLRKFLMVG